jgi:hypothetical protein
MPDQLQHSLYVYNDQGDARDNVPCSVNDPEVQALVALKDVFLKAVGSATAAKAVLPSWDVDSRSDTPSPGETECTVTYFMTLRDVTEVLDQVLLLPTATQCSCAHVSTA